MFFQFKLAAAHYKETHNGLSPTLVIDSVNVLASHAPEILQILQMEARNAVSKSEFTVVFVCSDGLAPQQISGIYLTFDSYPK